jgi:hypothetical protein
VEASLNALMAECQQKLRPVEFLLVQGQRQVLLDGDIVTPDEVKQRSYEQLERAGVTPGAAILLKSVFPSPGGSQRAKGTAYTCVGGHALVCFHSLHQHCHGKCSMHSTLNTCYTGGFECMHCRCALRTDTVLGGGHEHLPRGMGTWLEAVLLGPPPCCMSSWVNQGLPAALKVPCLPHIYPPQGTAGGEWVLRWARSGAWCTSSSMSG